MKYAVYCVNYNTAAETLRYLVSIGKALLQAPAATVDFFVGDNSESAGSLSSLAQDFMLSSDASAVSGRLSVKVHEFGKNLGYFGAVGSLMQAEDPSRYDYVVVSNVDITVSDSFFSEMEALKSDAGVGWVAPCIWSAMEHRDRNPKILKRYNRRRIQTFCLFFSIPVLHYLYTRLVYRKRHEGKSCDPGSVYAGHGSCIILTREYIGRCGCIDYPVFLFGEEIYLAEKCRLNALTVLYQPQVKVSDNEHASTGKMKKRIYYRHNLEAMRWVLKNCY